MKHQRYPRVSRLRKGYHRRQVDTFVNNVEISFSGMSPMPTAADVRQTGFEMVHGGYLPAAVDAALDALEERVLVVQGLSAGRRGKADPAGEAAVLKGELDAPYMQRFPRAGGFRRGYDIDGVDDFVDRLVTALDNETHLDVEEVRAVAFRPQRGGYREDAVDDVLDRVVEHLLVLRSRGVSDDAHRPPAGTATP